MPDELDHRTPQHFLNWSGARFPDPPVDPITASQFAGLIEKLKLDHTARAELKYVLEIRAGLRTPPSQG